MIFAVNSNTVMSHDSFDQDGEGSPAECRSWSVAASNRASRSSASVVTRVRHCFSRISVVWGVLRNSAYRGVACFGKTRISARTRVMRPQPRRGTTTPSTTAGHQRPREEWIEILVPALVTEENFARAQGLLYQNKIRSRRRTIAPSVVQGLVSCAKCGYALSRTSTQTSAR
jgi:recombinase